MKIIHDSHIDHVTTAHLRWILNAFAGRQGFYIQTMELPEDLPPLTCGLHGPSVGDEPVPAIDCREVKRPGRGWVSRVCDRPERETRTITVIAGPHEDDGVVLYTAYGGPCAPREPGDPSLSTDAEKAESRAFWAEHALSE